MYRSDLVSSSSGRFLSAGSVDNDGAPCRPPDRCCSSHTSSGRSDLKTRRCCISNCAVKYSRQGVRRWDGGSMQSAFGKSLTEGKRTCVCLCASNLHRTFSRCELRRVGWNDGGQTVLKQSRTEKNEPAGPPSHLVPAARVILRPTPHTAVRPL
ncbi:unnamed protein product [Pleuronectes platessa]|uniref:Uncharacterized protein n=1 Tax=Pleuronectes platessa TaxID=8262 RepID=A0A9N7TN19_PLEPL|nr:unnamed protein product [Pleuronectes platessa]